LPFQALQSGDHSLIEKRTVSYAPSISFLARASNTVKSDDPRLARLLALGNPALTRTEPNSLPKNQAESAAVLMGADWQPLPAAEKQVSELQKIYTPERSSIFVGAAAREDVFKREAGKFDILHFATHGVLNGRAPLYSYLLLSQANLSADEDGMLEAYEIMRMKLRARLVVLSACETARGEIAAGEGITGLAWALFLAGCPTTVVSQWKVESESNTVLMVNFHRRLRDGLAPAEALREASLALAKTLAYRHPFYWAPFVVVGIGSDKM
jgi:CHAT domain-containing protein